MYYKLWKKLFKSGDICERKKTKIIQKVIDTDLKVTEYEKDEENFYVRIVKESNNYQYTLIIEKSDTPINTFGKGENYINIIYSDLMLNGIYTVYYLTIEEFDEKYNENNQIKEFITNVLPILNDENAEHILISVNDIIKDITPVSISKTESDKFSESAEAYKKDGYKIVIDTIIFNEKIIM